MATLHRYKRGHTPGIQKGLKRPTLAWNKIKCSLLHHHSFGSDYKPRSSLCRHALHRTYSNDPDSHVLDGRMPATKTPSTHHPRRRNVTISMVGLTNSSIRKNLTTNGEPRRYSRVRRRRRSIMVGGSLCNGWGHC